MAARKKSSSNADTKVLGKLEAELRKLPAKDVAPPVIPVERLVAEARALAKVVESTRAALVKVGLEPKLADSLDVRATALAQAQSRLVGAREALRSVREVELEERGIALRSEMVADLRYATRGDADAQAHVDEVQEGGGVDDLVQDLRDLVGLFGQHGASLKKASVDIKGKSKAAGDIVNNLEKLVAERRSVTRDDGGTQELRDRAATYLQHALSEIRAAGVYAFRERPAQQAKFRSAYASARRARFARSKTTPKEKPADGRSTT